MRLAIVLSWWKLKSPAQGVDPMLAPELRDDVRAKLHASAGQLERGLGCTCFETKDYRPERGAFSR